MYAATVAIAGSRIAVPLRVSSEYPDTGSCQPLTVSGADDYSLGRWIQRNDRIERVAAIE
jgi:hypothetical protein